MVKKTIGRAGKENLMTRESNGINFKPIVNTMTSKKKYVTKNLIALKTKEKRVTILNI